MYKYAHKRLDRCDFEFILRTYYMTNNYKLNHWDCANEWSYYERNRSWFAAHLDHILTLKPTEWPEWFYLINELVVSD